MTPLLVSNDLKRITFKPLVSNINLRHDTPLRHGAKIVFLTSPNNPDGSVIPAADVDALLELPCLVVLDEAYIEFGTAESRVPLVTERENLVVLRTFSKRAALAVGMRNRL